MAVEVFIPKMSDHMDSAVIVAWLVAEGDEVAEGQPIVEIETDKVVAELVAPAGGFLAGVREGVTEGAVIPVGEVIAHIAGTLDEEVPALEPWGEDIAETADHAVVAPERHSVGDEPAASAPLTSAAEHPEGPVRASPAVRRLAAERGIDLSEIAGSGPLGSLTVRDVQAHASATVDSADRFELTSVQRITGERMLESAQTVPQFSVSVGVDMTSVLSLRDATSGSEGAGDRPSITAYLVRAIALALVAHPRLAASYENGNIRPLNRGNVGVAVATVAGLYVPVIKNADTKAVAAIATELAELASRAKNHQLVPDDMAAAGFTLSNLGMFDIDEFRAIVNPPQAAILAVGRVRSVPTATDKGIVAVPTMQATLTADHRVVDGAQAAVFLARVGWLLEHATTEFGCGDNA